MPREMATVGLDTALDVDLGTTLVLHRRNALVGLQATVVNGVPPAAVLVMVDASRRASQQYNAIFVMEQLEVAGAQVLCVLSNPRPSRRWHLDAGIGADQRILVLNKVCMFWCCNNRAVLLVDD
jgi:hypothetical protein